jgi:hypothetical protein
VLCDREKRVCVISERSSPRWAHKGISGLLAVQALGDTIGKPRHLIADRAYNYVTNDTFALPVWELGYTTIYDLHRSSARGTHPGPGSSDTTMDVGVRARLAQHADDIPHTGHPVRLRVHHHIVRRGLPGPADAVPARHPRMGGVVSPQGRDREPVRRPQTQPPHRGYWLNILNLHDWVTRREVLDSWGRFLDEPEPERRPRRRRRSTHSATRYAASLAATGPGR